MAGGHSPLHQFEIHKIIDLQLAGHDISITNSTVFLLGVVVAIMLFFSFGVKKANVIPTRFQALVESLYDFIASMVKENIGKEGLKYLPFVFSLFVLILGCNLAGMLPYSFTVTSHIATTFALALFAFLVVNIIGFARHGLHYFSLFVPHGVPVASLLLITPIEIISYLIRPFSLGIRLAVAMSAGHIIMKIFAGFVIALGVAGVFPFVFSMGLVGLELLVSFIQAFIFSILICIYLNDAVNLH